MQWLVFAFCLTFAVIRADDSAPRVNDGVDAPWGMFPSAVSINTTFRHCGGDIVDRQHVLTAAQCVFGDNRRLIDPYWITIVAGDINLGGVSHHRQTRKVVAIFPHPEFNIQTLENDLAVLRVDRPYELPSNTLNVANRTRRVVSLQENCQLAGWEDMTAIYLLQQRFISMAPMDRDICNQFYFHAGRVLENMLCATISGSCTANVGTGLYCDRVLVGILSYGTNCNVPHNLPVFTQILFNNPWIEQQFSETEGRPFGWSPGQL
ncbi:serine protease 55-like [Anopheles bellator]|uniref:serine protease 55-like n=1 Tax=Anopheles bellator TaxID=139047 RepID=UPI0026493B57|nr:serine protease 55-like [Anopheles bellator]